MTTHRASEEDVAEATQQILVAASQAAGALVRGLLFGPGRRPVANQVGELDVRTVHRVLRSRGKADGLTVDIYRLAAESGETGVGKERETEC